MRAHAKIAFCVSTSLVGICMAMPAFAQTAESDIIVTARRTEERLQDVPISIKTFNQQQLANANVVNAQDLARVTPSLSANSNFGNENSTFALRGFVQDNGTAPSVGVYFADVVAPRGASNGIPTGDGAGAGSFFDLQNVQVLKGPQGTLQGRNTTGGAILLVPQKPTGQFEGYVEGSIGNYDMKRIQAVVNVPVMDTLRIRIGVDRQTRDGYLKNNSGIGASDFGDVDYTAVRFSAVADLTPNIENYTIVSYSNSHTNSTYQKTVVADGTDGLGFFAASQVARQNARGDFWGGEQDYLGTYSKLEQWQVINTTTWKATDTLTLKNIISYAQLKDDLRSPLFATNFGPGISFAGTNPVPGGHTANESTFSEEFQIQGNALNDALIYQGGIYVEVSRPLGDVGSQTATFSQCSNIDQLICGGQPPFPAGANYTVGRTGYRDVGAYAQATYKFNDKFKLTGGFRYTWDREISDNQLITYSGFPAVPAQGRPTTYSCTNPLSSNANAGGLPLGTPIPIATLNLNTDCRIRFDQKSEAPTWLVDVDYTPVEDLLIYAKYSRGYRAGVVAPTVVQPFNYVNPEKVDTYEVGAKTSFRGAVRGTLNIAAFYNDFSNQQTQLGFNSDGSLPVSPNAAPVNLGKSRIWGVEIDGSLIPFKGLVIDGGYSHLDTKIRSLPDFASTPPYVLGGKPVAGDPLALAPRNKYTITGTYTLPLDESVGKISFGATFTHTDSQLANYNDRAYTGGPFSDPAIVAQIQALSYLQPTNLLNANVGWSSIAGSRVDVSLFATNVTKEKYYTYVPGLATGTGFEVASLGEPRMYGARLKYHW